MKGSFEYKPAPQEQTLPPQAEVQLTPEQIAQKREKVLQSLEKARLLPADWKSEAGKSRDEMVAALESALEELDTLERDIQAQPVETPTPARSKNPGLHIAEKKRATHPPLGKSRAAEAAV